MLIIDGHDVYEIDEECIKKHRVKGECKVLEKLKEKEQRRQKRILKNRKSCGPKRPAVKCKSAAAATSASVIAASTAKATTAEK